MKKLFLVTIITIISLGMIYSTNQMSATDTSKLYKKITVFSPKAGDKWTINSEKTISWIGKGLQHNVRIILGKNGSVVGNIAVNQSKSGTFKWKVGDLINGKAAVGDGYQIGVREQTGSNFVIIGKSGVFSITKPMLKLNIKPPKINTFLGIITVGNEQPQGTIRTHYQEDKCTEFIVKGEHFLNTEGKVLMYGDFTQANKISPRPATVIKWENERIECRVPAFLNGAKNQTVRIKVQTALNKKSNEYDLTFEGREEKPILQNDVKLIKCDGGIIADSGANASGGVCQTNTVGGSTSFPASVDVWHEPSDYDGLVVTGTDTFEINLKNGWTYSRGELITWIGVIQQGAPYPVMPVGQTGKWTFSYAWTTYGSEDSDVTGGVRYRQMFYATWPIGTNYK